MRLLSTLPDRCRLYAQMLTDPDFDRAGREVEPWREHYGWGQDRHLMADLWDAVIATIPRPKNSKAVTYPRPGTKKKATAGVPMSQILPRRLKPRG